MRLDVTSARMRKRLVAELSPRAPAQHDVAPLHPEDAQPRAVNEAQKLVKWAQAALSVVLSLRLPLDGVLNGTAQMAIRRFQGQTGVPQTGQLDQATILALAKAVGHPAPGMSPEHRIMPRWFRQERQGARAKPALGVHKKAHGPDDPWAEPATEQAVALPRPVEQGAQPELEPQKKARPKEVS